MGQILNFKKSILSTEWKKKYDDLMYRFHELYEDCDKCLEEGYKLYGGALELIDVEPLYIVKIVHLIGIIRTERIIETGEKDLDVIYFIKNHRYLIQDEYRKRHSEWLEAKSLSLNDDKYLNSAIHIYMDLLKYFKDIINQSKNEAEFIKQNQNYACMKMELADIYRRKKNKILSKKYAAESINIYMELFLNNNIGKNELKDYYNRFKNISELNNNYDEINRIDEILVSNEIAL